MQEIDYKPDPSHAPKVIMIGCAAFMMVIQTFAMAMAVVGYDDVIRAGAKKAEHDILASVETNSELALIREQLTIIQGAFAMQNKVNKIAAAKFELLEKDSHRKGHQ